MAGELLLDTGALVSLLDRSQRHQRDFSVYRINGRRRFDILPA